MKVYGPYIRKDGRSHVVIIHDNKRRQTKSYPRFLLEKELGRELTIDEEVDHIDGNFLNNAMCNLQILSKIANRQKAIVEHNRQEKYMSFKCPCCSKDFSGLVRQYRNNQIKQGKSGPYCSRRCVGKTHH